MVQACGELRNQTATPGVGQIPHGRGADDTTQQADRAVVSATRSRSKESAGTDGFYCYIDIKSVGA